VESTTDAAATTAESSQATDLPKGNQATATSTGDSKEKSISMEIGSAEDVQHSATADEVAAENKTTEGEREASATNQDEHDDHVVEGEEDTVIY
jgi:hypothetical protein